MRKGLLISGVLLGSMVLSGCSAAGTSRDMQAHARLDESRNLIVYPLDEYRVSDDQIRTMELARIRIVEGCLRDHGIPVKPVEGRRDGLDWGSRNYGLWNETAARREAQLMASVGQNHEDRGTFYDAATGDVRAQCLEERKDQVQRVSFVEGDQNYGLADKLSLEVNDKAKNTPEWRNAVADWESCLKDNGLTPVRDQWITQESLNASSKDLSDPGNAEELTRVSLLEAKCSQSTGMAQKLADIEASFQIPLIEEHQAELNEVKNLIQAKVQGAQSFLQGAES